MTFLVHFTGSGAPLFSASSTGPVRLGMDFETQMEAFCASLRQVVGDGPSVRCWAYRAGAGMYLALDVEGSGESRSLTLIEGDKADLPTPDCVAEYAALECVVTDAVDAFYLALRVLASLSPSSLRLGPRITTK